MKDGFFCYAAIFHHEEHEDHQILKPFVRGVAFVMFRVFVMKNPGFGW